MVGSRDEDGGHPLKYKFGQSERSVSQSILSQIEYLCEAKYMSLG